MSVFTSSATVSRRYYDKRPRTVAEQNIKSMSESLGLEVPEWKSLRALSKSEVIDKAMALHRLFPE